MGGLVAFAPVIEAIAPIASTLLGGLMSPSAPTPAPLPPAPTPAEAPPVPEVTKAEELGEEPVVDTEAARVRAAKRRKEASQRQLFNLSNSEDESVVLTKNLLGE